MVQCHANYRRNSVTDMRLKVTTESLLPKIIEHHAHTVIAIVHDSVAWLKIFSPFRQVAGEIAKQHRMNFCQSRPISVRAVRTEKESKEAMKHRYRVKFRYKNRRKVAMFHIALFYTS